MNYNNTEPTPGQWCWFWDYKEGYIEPRKFKNKYKEKFYDQYETLWRNCRPLTEQELADNNLLNIKQDEKENTMQEQMFKTYYENTDIKKVACPDISFDTLYNYACNAITELKGRIAELINEGIVLKNTMQEQISEEMADKLLHVVGNDEARKNIKINWQAAGYIKESALERVRNYYKKWDKDEINYNHFDVLYQLCEAAINHQESHVIDRDQADVND